VKVLIACEYSGVVRDAFIAKGHDAVSCDIIDTEVRGPHIKGDVSDLFNEHWDLIIAHPPCTYLCRQSSRWIESRGLQKEFDEAWKFFKLIKSADSGKICIENPIPHRLAKIKMGDYDQIIQPYQFGHDYSKKTCLWLKGLPKLKPTKEVELTYYTTPKGRRYTAGWYFTPRNSTARSRTFQGIAHAMAAQWG
jgi:hypothetical protein